MTTEVITALGIKEIDMKHKIVVITADNQTNATFLLSSIMSHCATNQNTAVLLVPFQNSYRHFYHIGMKLGYNLDEMLESNRFDVIEPLKILNRNLKGLPIDDECSIDFLDDNKSIVLHRLYQCIEDKFQKLSKSNTSVYLIIENISNLLELNFTIKDFVIFKQLLKSIFERAGRREFPEVLSIVISTTITNEKDLIVANVYRHVADILVNLSGLKTGKSNLVTGLMSINRKENYLSGWTLQKDYHYKLYDRQIKLFAPGTI